MNTQAKPEILFTAPTGRVPSPGWAREYAHRVVDAPGIRHLKSLPWLTVVQAKAPTSFARHAAFLSALAKRTLSSPSPSKVVFLFSQGPRLRADDFSAVLRWFPASVVEFAQGARNGALAVEEAWAKVLKERAEDSGRDPLGQIKSVVRATADLRAESGRLSADRVAETFRLSVAEVAKILGATRQAVSKTPDAQALQEGLRSFERIARLRTVLPSEDFRKWLNIPREDLGGRSPLALVRGRGVGGRRPRRGRAHGSARLSPARRERGLSLDGLPTKSLDALLVRCVPQLGFDAGTPPSYFFASGRAHRLNPGGVYCLSFGG